MVRSGTLWYGTESPGWSLNTGFGDRTFRALDVTFDPPFEVAPNVLVALAGVDSEHATNLRVVVEAYDIEPGEFSIRVRTWHDTILYNVQIAWLAHD